MKAHDDDRLGTPFGSGAAAWKKPLLFAVVALLVLGALGLALRAVMDSTEPPRSAQAPAAPAAPGVSAKRDAPREASASTSAPAPLPAGAPPLPALAESDEEVRATLADLLPESAQPALVPNDLLRRIAVQSDGFARGKLLRDKLQLPAAGGKLVVEERDGKPYLSAANHARYDALVDSVAGIDAQAVARWFSRYEPLLQQAFDELGNGQRPVREVIIAGLDTLLAAPVVEGEIELVRPSVFYKFADPALEALPETQKLMIRVGPRNRALLMENARRLREALAG